MLDAESSLVMFSLSAEISVEERMSVWERIGIMFVRWERRRRYSMSTGLIPGLC